MKTTDDIRKCIAERGTVFSDVDPETLTQKRRTALKNICKKHDCNEVEECFSKKSKGEI